MNLKKITTAQLIKIFAGELLKLTQHPKYRKNLEKFERKQRNEEIIKRLKERKSSDEYVPQTPAEKRIYDKVTKNKGPVKKISDEDLTDYLEAYRDTNQIYNDFNLALDRGLIDMAADYLKGAGALDPNNSNEPEICESILMRLKTYTKNKHDQDTKQLLNNIEIWIDSDTNEHSFIPSDELDEYVIEGLEFDSGYDEKGKIYYTSKLGKEVS